MAPLTVDNVVAGLLWRLFGVLFLVVTGIAALLRAWEVAHG